ncbi:MAG: hypothetical protein ACOC1S_04160, partial [bacterium]
KSETNQKFGPNYRNHRSISDMVDCLVPLGDYRGIIFSNNKSWEVRLGGGRLEPFYEYYRKPEYAWALKQKKRGSLQTLLYGVPELPEVEDPRPEMVNSENAGFYVLRSSFDKEEPEEQLQAVLKCGTPGGGHRHYDQTDLLSIMRYGRSFYNTQSAWWGGVYHHMYNDWLIKSANHNMVIVDQGNQGVTRPEKLLLKKEEKYKSTAVQVKAPWADMSFWPKGTEEKIKDLGKILQRRLMTLTEDYIIVADYLSDISQGKEDKGSHIYDWLIHPVGYKGIKTEEKEFLHHKEKFAEKGACQYITDCEWYRYKSPACIQFEQFFQNDSKNKDGVLKLDVHALWPVEGKLMLGFDPLGQEKNEDLPDEERRRTLSLRTEGKETRYLTLIEAYEQESKIADIEVINADKVRVVLKDGRVQVHEISNFTEKGEDITAEMIEK